jgi:hypothetical protein
MQRFKREFLRNIKVAAAYWRADHNDRFTYTAVYEVPANNYRDLSAWYLKEAGHCWREARAGCIACARDNRIAAIEAGFRLP